MKPRIFDPSFRYVSAANTDLRKTFARLRREARERAAVPTPANVKPIKAKKA